MDDHRSADAPDGIPADDSLPEDRSATGARARDSEQAADESSRDAEPTRTPMRRPRQRRRATTPPPPGSDPSPIAEPERHRVDENDARLTAEKPPHY
ncbi:MAG: hypothetical protein Q7T15_03175 [Microcella sp.]|uniref:hypothetical protein n=1 Tax=Microcella sp. TaxID=1913979 RepID=UPI00271789C6|nr:hypothetical protein [Microcella sp.]MDO8337242.1 hypothetical protein [Microcella sp.]